MKKIKVRDPYTDHLTEYREDVDRIVLVLKYHDYEATPDQAVRLWELYSESVAAGWLGLPRDNDEVFECIEPYFEAQGG